MAENIPPDSQPGRPYYESLRTTLRSTIATKRKLDDQIAALEDQLYKAETAYLEETANSGNIVRGFDAWVKGVQLGTGRSEDRRGRRVREDERIFSRSSVGWMKAQEGSDSNPTSHAATPTGSYPSGNGLGRDAQRDRNKKKRAMEKDEEEDVKGVKRGKISYARD